MKISLAQLPNIIVSGISNLTYPPRCQSCGRSFGLFERKVLCEICHENITLNVPPFCRKCGRSGDYQDTDYICGDCRFRVHYFDASYAVCIYDGIIRECIHNFKYNLRFALEPLFRDLMVGFTEKYIDMSRYDWIIPVPLHSVKQRDRTFNQSAILASFLSKRFKIPMLKNNLIKTRLGKPQMMLPRHRRLKDIKGSFKIKKPILLKGKSVLLIDDVFTTGATADECSKTLKRAGANLVEVLTLARGL